MGVYCVRASSCELDARASARRLMLVVPRDVLNLMLAHIKCDAKLMAACMSNANQPTSAVRQRVVILQQDYYAIAGAQQLWPRQSIKVCAPWAHFAHSSACSHLHTILEVLNWSCILSVSVNPYPDVTYSIFRALCACVRACVQAYVLLFTSKPIHWPCTYAVRTTSLCRLWRRAPTRAACPGDRKWQHI